MKTTTSMTGGAYVDRSRIKTHTPIRQKRQELSLRLDALGRCEQDDSAEGKELKAKIALCDELLEAEC